MIVRTTLYSVQYGVAILKSHALIDVTMPLLEEFVLTERGEVNEWDPQLTECLAGVFHPTDVLVWIVFLERGYGSHLTWSKTKKIGRKSLQTRIQEMRQALRRSSHPWRRQPTALLGGRPASGTSYSSYRLRIAVWP